MANVEQFFEKIQSQMDAFYRKQGADAHVDERHAEITMLCHGPRILDIGCGTGDLLLALQAKHPEWELHGTDISSVALDMARQRGLRAELYCQADVPGGPFDTVVLSQVLEHLDREAGCWLLDQVTRISARIIVSVPNNNAVKSPHHIRVFSVASLLDLLLNYGNVKLHDWPGSRRRLIAVVMKRNNG